jgi:hypothetical protein
LHLRQTLGIIAAKLTQYFLVESSDLLVRRSFRLGEALCHVQRRHGIGTRRILLVHVLCMTMSGRDRGEQSEEQYAEVAEVIHAVDDNC